MDKPDDGLNECDVNPDERFFPSEDLILEVMRSYQFKPIEAINAELHAHKIDPQPTIDAVTELVTRALRESRHRRSVHILIVRPEASPVVIVIVPAGHGVLSRLARWRVRRAPFMRHRKLMAVA
jgi:hypothetical protein